MKLVLSAVLFSTVALAGAELAYPADWRSWQHVKSMVIPDKSHGLYGFHQVYVLPSALAAYKAGSGYADGASLAVPFYEVREAGGAVSQGPLLKVLLMKRERRAVETGGWTFAAFDPSGKRLELDAKTACFTCHQPRKDRAFVFSEWAD